MLNENVAVGGWQDIIGLFKIWNVDSTGQASSENAYQINYKCFMFTMIMIQEAVFESGAYKEFITGRLPMYRILSTMKAQACAYLFNNQKIRKVIITRDEKSKLLKKLSVVQKQLQRWNKLFKKDKKGDKALPIEEKKE